MIEWTLPELEQLMNVESLRRKIAAAHAKRMALPTIKEREQARLSTFLSIEDWTRVWFVHEHVTPIAQGWAKEAMPPATHHVECRRVINDALCTPWVPLEEVEAPTASALIAHLVTIYGFEPELEIVGHGNRIVEDHNRYQYRFVTMPQLRIPTREQMQTLVGVFQGMARQ
ncbi:hypothetical protein CS062_17380 [Roseateles chitinivorans]|uniref:Uncharacterized protein n=1 Tax=Roseateles chitinivorans TaxID=2917965 RepID=A0A2G9C684_9BURK|nr:hypothetical protein [Roseateles chitinivorans]PIM51897.1 hypothetical protein CS062_17380 [Roseateles chitinivorans]